MPLMMKNSLLLIAAVLALGSAPSAFAQSVQNQPVQGQTYQSQPVQGQTQVLQAAWCKTGSDANLDFIRRKVDEMAGQIKAMNQVNTGRAERIKTLTEEVKSLSKDIKSERAKHDKTKADTPKKYAKYKATWIDSGRLAALQQKKQLGKTKLNELKTLRTAFNQTKSSRDALSTRYTNIAGVMLDQNRDCSAALTALAAQR